MLKLPSWELRLLFAYYNRVPTPDERIEWAIAHFTCIYVNAHRKKGKPESKITDFLLFRDAWMYRPNTGDPDLDHDIQQLMRVFGNRVVINDSPG